MEKWERHMEHAIENTEKTPDLLLSLIRESTRYVCVVFPFFGFEHAFLICLPFSYYAFIFRSTVFLLPHLLIITRLHLIVPCDVALVAFS